ncbi:MAG: GNAT family N-acetyltransferase [Desulfovibrionaceae bacterium]|nr:GNAT family N-acetyltransferase [Desulfovibrionaceae bacterium]MBF0513145.1 GNAT family N-acetyltransferase [Desulfovibrionaceae bacterium]
MHIDFIDVKSNIEKIESLWNEYCLSSDHSYFMSPGWIHAWIECFSAGEQFQLMTIKNGTSPIYATIVNFKRQFRGGIFPSRVLNINCTGDYEKDSVCIEYNHFLQLGDDSFDINEFLKSIDTPWDEIYIPGMCLDRNPGKAIRECDQDWVIYDYDKPNFSVDLCVIPQERTGYVDSLSKSTRNHIRRTIKFYDAVGEIKLRRAASIEEALGMLADLIELKKIILSKRNGASSLNEHFVKHSTALIRNRFETGEIQMLKIQAGDQVIGYIYNLVYHGHVYFYQSGFHYERDNKASPGMLANAEAIVYNARLGNKVYDFLAGEERYKECFANQRSSMLWVRILKPSIKNWAMKTLRNARERMRSSGKK